METPNLTETRITGTAMNYLFVCPRKLWFFQNQIEMEHTSDAVALGRLLHEERYGRQKRKETQIDDLIRIDFIDKDGVLHDVKSGQAMEKAHEMQILYYLYLLKQKGLANRKGVINYPRQRRTVEVELTPEKEREVEAAIERVERISSQPVPPDVEFTKICKSCSYLELCWS
jgi:CRISPR-associated exonuclease Cas4